MKDVRVADSHMLPVFWVIWQPIVDMLVTERIDFVLGIHLCDRHDRCG